MPSWAIGVDFGGTAIKVGLVSGRGQVMGRRALATPDHATPASFLAGLTEAVEQLLSQANLRRSSLHGVGVGAPGVIDVSRGVVKRLVNVPGGWPEVPLRRLLERHLRCRCVVDNDANVVALGEWRFGAGAGTRDSIYVTLGTGVGGGLVIDGKLVHGATGAAGEIGHLRVARGGPRCGCGNRGCLEAFVGTAAILRKARAAIRRGNRLLSRFASQQQGRLTPELVSRAARLGDPEAKAIWRQVGYHLGLGLSSLVNLLSPERIVIGGGVAKAWPWFAPSMLVTMRQCAFAFPVNVVRVVRAKLGDRAGMIGGAVLVWEHTSQRGAR